MKNRKAHKRTYAQGGSTQVVVKDSGGKVYIYNSIEELITMLNTQFDLMTFELIKE